MRPKQAVVQGLTLSLLLGPSLALAQLTGELRQPIIYGEDDRKEVYEAESDVLRARARESVVAFVSPRALSYDPSGAVSIHAPSLGEAFNLCASEPFAEEPSLAFCSGVLVDDDLVATAGHCLGGSVQEPSVACRDLAVVFDYLYDAAGQLAPLDSEDVYRCRRVVAWSQGSNADPDFGVIQLDRPVRSGLSPAPFSEDEVLLGEHLNVIGFGAGLPAKIEGGAFATLDSPFPEYFTATTDTFAGASGSALFDDAGEILGLHVRGQPDWTTAGACTVAVRTDTGEEEHQRASSVLAAICSSGWPSPRLCGTEAACGDGVCSATESCATDCPLPRCGDARCEGTEPFVCDTDCPSFVEVPAEWVCPAAYYGDLLGCDCNCGARDVDCDNPRQEVLNCGPASFCNSEGACERFSAESDEQLASGDSEGEYSTNGRPAGADAPKPGDELIVDERDLPSEPLDKKAAAEGGCALGSTRAPAPWLALWPILLFRRRSRRLRSSRATARGALPDARGSKDSWADRSRAA